MQACQWALTRKQTLLGGGALERGHGAPLEHLAQLGDALRGVGAVAVIDAAELVLGQTAKEGGVSTGADTKANAQELIREAGGLLERLQRGVALETHGESESSLGAETVGRDTASTGAEAGAEACQGALTERQTLGSGGALQRRHSASLEPLAQSNDAVSGGNELSPYPVVVPTNTVATEPGGSKRSTQCQWALTRTGRWVRAGGKATHLSSLSTPFSLMQLAMMMAEATPSPLSDRSIFSAGFVPLSLSI